MGELLQIPLFPVVNIPAFQGKDYDRLKLLEVGADEAERWERRKKKKNPDQGFSTYEDATIRSAANHILCTIITVLISVYFSQKLQLKLCSMKFPAPVYIHSSPPPHTSISFIPLPLTDGLPKPHLSYLYREVLNI